MPKPINFETDKGVNAISRRTGVSITTVSRKLAAGKTELEIVQDAAVYNEQQKRRRTKKDETNSKTETFYEAQRRKEVAQASLREVELAQKRGELVPISDVNVWVAGMILRSRDILLRIAPELRDSLALQSDPIKCQELIDAEIHRALSALAEFQATSRT